MRVTKPGGKRLTADLLGEHFRQTVQIAAVRMEKCGTDDKAVLYFAGHEKGLALNATNIDTLVTLFGTDESEFWIGRTVELFTTMTSYGGRQLLGIRVGSASSRPLPTTTPAPQPLVDPRRTGALGLAPPPVPRQPGEDDEALAPMTHDHIRW